MSKKQNKIILLSISLALSVFILTGCQKQDNEITKNTNENEISSENNQDQSYSDSKNTVTETKILTINNKCIGCRKCTMIAPNNFEMNWSKAEVISQENIDQSNIQTAIDRCPVDAIKLIEA